MRLWKLLRGWLPSVPDNLSILNPAPPEKERPGLIRRILGNEAPSTDRLYVLTVDFPVDEHKARALDEMLDPLREKYGLDFLIVEPGIQLKRFNEF